MAFPIPFPLKWLGSGPTTALQVYFWTLVLVLIASLPGQAAEVPLFRKTDQANVISPLTPGTNVRLLADAEFPPFSFRAANGQPSGLSIDLALLACAEMKATCSVDMRPFSELLPALLRNDGDVIVSGLRLNDQLLNTVSMTRPYFWSFGRFAARVDAKVTSAEPAVLSSFKIGFVEGTGHAAFVRKHYADAQLVPLPSAEALHAALKSGAVDVSFEDNMALAFWLAGTDSAGCCKPLGGPFVDRANFSHNLAYLVRRDEAALLKAMDMALDRLQDNGSTGKLLSRYFPANYW